MKLRVKFTKEGTMKYIGHLDVMRFFQKLIRRAGIDVSYTEGFSPHQKMSFAAPLGLGFTSEGEYMDFEAGTAGPSEEMVRRMNACSIPEIRILSCRLLPEGKTNAMASLSAAAYRFRFPSSDPEKLASQWARFLAEEHIVIEKKTKTKTEETDIRPLIYRCEPERDTVCLLIAAGSRTTLKPQTLLTAWYAFLGSEETGEEALIRGDVEICRLDMYTGEENAWIPLNDVGEDLP